MKAVSINTIQGDVAEGEMRVTHVRFGGAVRSGVCAPGTSASLSMVAGAGPGETLCRATVVGEAGDAWQVKPKDVAGSILARRAAGCILAPRPSDLVLVLQGKAGEDHFILNVLDRACGPSILDFAGDLEVRVPDGNTRIISRALGLEATEQAAISSPKLSLSAENATMRFGVLELLARRLDAGVAQVVSSCDSVRFAASSFFASIARSISSVGFVLSRAKRMRIEVDGRYAVKSGQASILAKDEVAVDGDRITIG